MRRRDFIGVMASSTVAWSPLAHAQQPMLVIGFLASRSPADSTDVAAAFRKGLDESGFTEDRNITIEYRWARGQYHRLPALTAELVKWPVAVIAAFGPPAAQAAKAASAVIPVVFASGGDPVAMGLVASLKRPGGNVSGVNLYTGLLGAKRLGLLRELIPLAGVVAVLRNPDNLETDEEVREAQAAAGALQREIVVVSAANDAELDAAFAEAVHRQARALMVASDPFFLGRRELIVSLAARHRLPAIYQFRAFVAAGGLISYGTNLADAYQQAGLQVARILKGAKPADLPVMQASKFELAINLRAARAINLTVPQTLLAIADEVIE